MIDKQCAVCIEPATRIAVDQLREQNLSLRAIAERVKRSKSSIGRHLKHAENPRRRGSRTTKAGTSQAVRGRCQACGTSMTSTDAESLLKRAERLLWIAETIAAKAQADDDARLALQAVDRARAALETMMRATGQIGGDGTTVNIAIDNRRKAEAVLAGLSVDELRAIANGTTIAMIEGEAIPLPPAE